MSGSLEGSGNTPPPPYFASSAMSDFPDNGVPGMQTVPDRVNTTDNIPNANTKLDALGNESTE